MAVESQRERIQQPAEHDRRGEESAEHHRTRAELLSWFIAEEHAEHERHKKGEQHEKQEVTSHLRPSAMSYASRITRKFKSPDTIRKQFPYS